MIARLVPLFLLGLLVALCGCKALCPDSLGAIGYECAELYVPVP